MKYNFASESITAKRKARLDLKRLAQLKESQAEFNEQHRAGKRTVAYIPLASSSEYESVRAFCREEDLHLEATLQTRARLQELIELISDREHVDRLVLCGTDAIALGDLIG